MAAPRNPKAQKRLGARVKALREARGLTQEALAFDAGIHVNHLSSLERGEAKAVRETASATEGDA